MGEDEPVTNNKNKNVISEKIIKDKFEYAEEVREEETLSIQDKELELIIKALERNNRKRKARANLSTPIKRVISLSLWKTF